MRTSRELVLWDAVTPVAVTSSTDATPIVVTATAHGLVTGDLVQINGHTTNIAANGIFRIVKVTADTYQLKDKDSGASIAGSGAGAGASGVMVVAPKVVYVADWRNIIFSVESSGSLNATFKMQELCRFLLTWLDLISCKYSFAIHTIDLSFICYDQST